MDLGDGRADWDMIRLVVLQPGGFKDDIHFEMRHEFIRHLPSWTLRTFYSDWEHPLEELPTYEALSYTWGTSSAQEFIYIDSKPLEVRTNLVTALRYLRREKEPRTLWIDAICIDQTNIPERNIQVQRMAQIYRQASCVLVWLGESSHNSDVAFDVLERVGGAEDQMVLEPRTMKWSSEKEHWVLRPKDPKRIQGPIDLKPEEWKALYDLFINRAWWTRMWIVQEIAYPLSARLLCGRRSLHWDTLENLFTWNSKFDKMANETWFIDMTKNASTLAKLRKDAQLAQLLLVFKNRGTNLRTLALANVT